MAEKVGGEFLVNTTTQSWQIDSSVRGLSDGDFLVTWGDWSRTGADTSSHAIRGQVYGADGRTQGSEFLVNTTIEDDQEDPLVVALYSGGFLISWADVSAEDTGGPRTTRVQEFAAVGGEFEVQTNSYDGSLFEVA